MQDTSRFQRDTIGNWKLESVISSPGITLPSLLSLLVKSMSSSSSSLFIDYF